MKGIRWQIAAGAGLVAMVEKFVFEKGGELSLRDIAAVGGDEDSVKEAHDQGSVVG